MTFEGIVVQALPFLSGILNGTFGYAVAHYKSGEKFDGRNFAESVGSGFFVAIVSMLAGVDTASAYGLLAIQFGTYIVDKIVGVISKVGSSKSSTTSTAITPVKTN